MDQSACGPSLTVQDVMEVLQERYGPLRWEGPRYDAVSELVYTILSQNTSDVNSKRAFDNLMERFGSLEAVAQADPRDIEDAIRMGGLARSKAPRIKAVLQHILGEVGSLDLSFLAELPLEEAKAWLLRLPGVGPKTAAIVLCFSFGMPAMPVDTHVHRVARRMGLIGPKVTAERAHDLLEELVPPEQVYPFHLYLIRHGRQVCRARRPLCDECVFAPTQERPCWGCPSYEPS